MWTRLLAVGVGDLRGLVQALGFRDRSAFLAISKLDQGLPSHFAEQRDSRSFNRRVQCRRLLVQSALASGVCQHFRKPWCLSTSWPSVCRRWWALGYPAVRRVHARLPAVAIPRIGNVHKPLLMPNMTIIVSAMVVLVTSGCSVSMKNDEGGGDASGSDCTESDEEE